MSRLSKLWKKLRSWNRSTTSEAADNALGSERDPCTREIQLAAYDPPARYSPR